MPPAPSAAPAPSPAAAAPAPADDRLAERLRGFGPIGIATMLAILAGNLLFIPLSGLLILAWAKRTGTPWATLGFSRPRSWTLTIAVGLILGTAFKLVMKAVVMPLLGADPVNHAFHFLAGNPAAIPGFLYAIFAGAGFSEETLFRGYLFERLGKLLGESAIAKAAAVVITALVFGFAHWPAQGLTGTEQATIVGLVYGAIYATTRRLWGLMAAHVAFDLTAYALIYWNLETRVAHWVFR